MTTIDRRGVSLSQTDTPVAGDPNSGLAIKTRAIVATTANIVLSGVQTIDTVVVGNANERVLVKNQTDARQNGIYNAQAGNWQRAIDANNSSQFTQGTLIDIVQGTQANAQFQLVTADPIVLGTTGLVFLAQSAVPSSRRVNATGPLLVNGAGSATLAADVTLSISPNGINYALLQKASAGTILGNPTGALANVSEIGLGATLAFAAALLTTVAMTGDVATAANSFATTIQPNVVSYSKMQQVAASRVLGNPTGVLANASEISLGATLAFSGTALQTAAMTGDVAASANSFVTTIQPAAVTLAKMANLTGLSVIGNAGNTSATPAAVAGTTDQVLRITSAGTGLGFGSINLAAAAAVTGTLGAGNGGTGNATYAIGDLLQASAATTLTRLAAVATGNVLISGGVTTVSSWGKVGLTTHVTGTLGPTNGGTGLATYTLGDTVYASAANTLSALAGNITATKKFLTQTGTGTVSAAPAWGTIVAADVPGSALTASNDTNVTLTLGGTPGTALLAASSITAGWTGTLAVARGGTGGGAASGTLLDNITGFAATGVLSRTGAGTYAFRTIAGTTNRLTVTNGDGVAGAPTLDISTSYVGQATITTLGTIGTGTWGATKIGLAFGGTNADLSATGGTSQVLKQTTLGGAITVAQLAASDLSNGTIGSGAVVLATSPTLVTPVLGVATATSINKVALTAPATGSTLTIADGKTLTASNSLTLAGTDATTMTFPGASDTLGGLATAQTWTKQNVHTVALTVASAAGATLDDLKVAAATTTITGTTGIATAAGFNKVGIYQPTFTDASAVTITTAATLYVDNAPAAAGSVTITNPWAINVGAGNVRFPGTGNQLGTITSGIWNGTKIGLAFGGTNVDLSATGGTSQVLKQTSVGGNITVAQLAASDLSNGVSGSGAVVLATGATLSGAIHTGTTDIQQAFQLSGAITPTALAADVNDYNPTGLSTTSIIRQDGGAVDRNITGLTALAGGRVICIENIGTTNKLILNDQSASSLAANRFILGSNISLSPNQSAMLWYDTTSTRWRCLGVFTSGGGTGGTVTSVATGWGTTGGTITTSGTISIATSNPPYGFGPAVNLSLAASVATNALTITVNGNNGSTPSASNPVLFPFRDSTIANGGPLWRAQTAALSITVPASQALGTVANVPFRFWICALDNAGTVELAVVNCVVGGASPTQVFPIAEHALQSTTAIATAPSAAVFYSTTARSAKAIVILGYVEYASGLAVAGTYASAPTETQLYGPGIKKPGDIVQTVFLTKAAISSLSSSTAATTNTTKSITPTSAANLVLAAWGGMASSGNAVASAALAQLARGGTLIGPQIVWDGPSSLAGQMSDMYFDAPGSTSAQTYAVFLSNQDNVTTVSFGNGATGRILLQEVMG